MGYSPKEAELQISFNYVSSKNNPVEREYQKLKNQLNS